MKLTQDEKHLDAALIVLGCMAVAAIIVLVALLSRGVP
jgi:hypothetical protein